MNMKKVLKIFVAAVMLVAVFGAMNAMAADEIEVIIDAQKIDFDVPPQIINDRTMIPFRYVANAFDAEVDYKEEADGSKIVTAVQGDKTLLLTIGSTDALLIENGTETVLTFDVAPLIVESRTLVPVRLIAEAFGCSVGWDGENKTVMIIDICSEKVDELKKQAPELFDNVLNLNLTALSGYYNVKLGISEGEFENIISASLATDENAVQFTSNYGFGEVDMIVTENALYGKSPYTGEKWLKESFDTDYNYGLEELGSIKTSDLVIDSDMLLKAYADSIMSMELSAGETFSSFYTPINVMIDSVKKGNLKITETENSKKTDYTVAFLVDGISYEISISKSVENGILKVFDISCKLTFEDSDTTNEYSLSIEREDAAADVEIIIPSADDIIAE